MKLRNITHEFTVFLICVTCILSCSKEESSIVSLTEFEGLVMDCETDQVERDAMVYLKLKRSDIETFFVDDFEYIDSTRTNSNGVFKFAVDTENYKYYKYSVSKENKLYKENDGDVIIIATQISDEQSTIIDTVYLGDRASIELDIMDSVSSNYSQLGIIVTDLNPEIPYFPLQLFFTKPFNDTLLSLDFVFGIIDTVELRILKDFDEPIIENVVLEKHVTKHFDIDF